MHENKSRHKALAATYLHKKIKRCLHHTLHVSIGHIVIGPSLALGIINNNDSSSLESISQSPDPQTTRHGDVNHVCIHMISFETDMYILFCISNISSINKIKIPIPPHLSSVWRTMTPEASSERVGLRLLLWGSHPMHKCSFPKIESTFPEPRTAS